MIHCEILGTLSTQLLEFLNYLELATKFNCQEVAQGCVQYLEVVPWEDKKEELILKLVPKLGPSNAS